MSRELQIDDEFKNLIPPLSEDEFSRLEKSILAKGVRDSIITWNGVIVDGHNRYAICQKHGLDYPTREEQFESRDAAKICIIENQFGRRNLSAYSRGLLALELEPLYAAEAKRRSDANLKRGAKVPEVQNSSLRENEGKTREKVAKAAGVSHDTIRKIKAIEAEAAKGNEKAVKVRNELMSGERKSIHGGYTEVCGKQKPRKKSEMVLEDGLTICAMCGEPINPGDEHSSKQYAHKQCVNDYNNDWRKSNNKYSEYSRKYRSADEDLNANVAVYTRESFFQELIDSADILHRSWRNSVQINAENNVPISDDEREQLEAAVLNLKRVVTELQNRGNNA